MTTEQILDNDKMQAILDRVQKALGAYDPRKEGSQSKAVRTLLSAVEECRKYVDENSRNDGGASQTLVRQLDDLLATSPHFRRFAGNEQDIRARHTRRLAKEHLDEVQRDLKHLLDEEESQKKREKLDWVKQHPVFSKLRRETSKKSLPKTTYVLLFKRSAETGEPDLITKKAQNLVITRMRPREFADALHIYNAYHNKAEIVGAAVIAEKQLLAGIGELPKPTETKDQLGVLLGLSKEAASQPAKQFLTGNAVLNELHEMVARREIPKDAYVLLFRETNAVGHAKTSAPSDAIPKQRVEAAASEPEAAASEPEAAASEPEAAASEPEAAASEPAAAASEPEAAASELEAAASEPEAAASEPEAAISEVTPTTSNLTGQETTQPSVASGNFTIVLRPNQEGKVITRFWAPDFTNPHKVYQTFGNQTPIVGAAVIAKNDLIKVVGHVPAPTGSQSQLDAIMQHSYAAIEKPAVDYVETNDVLRQLRQLATSDYPHRNPTVLLFVPSATGSVEVLSVPGAGTRIPLNDFQHTRRIHERFSGGAEIVGASVVANMQAPTPVKATAGATKEKHDGPRRRGEREPAGKPAVVAAFGRTPLKLNLLATSEVLNRLGIHI